MFLYRILVSLQIVSCLISFQAEGSNNSTVNANSTSIQTSSPTINGSISTSTTLVSMTTTVTSTIGIQPTSSSTAVTVPSSTVAAPTTSPPPSEGAKEAVVMTVRGMTVGQFEAKRSSFISALKTVVAVYCSDRTCEETSQRKRRATTAEQVYIASGYPKESPYTSGDLMVAVFVSTGDSKFLPKDVLLVIVQDFRGNLSSALGNEITGVGRLHLDVYIKKTESTDGTSGKDKILYIFFGVFAGLVFILAVCITVTCWIGRKGETENEVRPLTTSNLELVDNQGGSQRIEQR